MYAENSANFRATAREGKQQKRLISAQLICKRLRTFLLLVSVWILLFMHVISVLSQCMFGIYYVTSYTNL